MEKTLKTVAFIPVRGGSKSIPLKNIKDFCGRPLVYWSIVAATKCTEIDEVFVATDDIRIKETVLSFGFSNVNVIERSAESAHDQAPSETVLLEFANRIKAERIVFIQATSPLLEAEDLTEALRKLDDVQADSLVSVVRQKRFIWQEHEGEASPQNYNPLSRPRRQDWEGYLVENGAFYITSRDQLLSSKCRVSGKIALYEMSEDTYLELDELTDWAIIEKIKEMKLESQANRDIAWPSLNLFISDVDGVLTDAGMYYSTDGQELKKFNTRDGKGIELLRRAGIKVMFLTAEDIEVVRARAKKLNVDYLFMGIKNKKKFLAEFFEANPQFAFHKTAYIGDDVNDLECLQAAAFSAAPQDAHSSVRREVDYVCSLSGGHGCVREVSDFLLTKRN
ncbi:acylneuraminate cytidylyltransferase [Cohnella sp. CIP 111063]|uniref:N-acylneuraminate cytidylyltransferase n=1 Tax=unclassified Cohnella TaxID=2636738 RepID=UPI000B8C14B1|nr:MULTISPECIES: N-acylneuraminate cytidylyltransferase [unclassified Cohnella]OXS55869.1 acylneuraminate cytidylyltransferase [Cohnella sp. CIP 111063]PRX67070.1 N-acylneuraminate cytidylyltransferase [Cohnella sp. SGD-V74]